MAIWFQAIFVLASILSLVGGDTVFWRRPVPEFDIDLDTDPHHRFDKVVEHFNDTIQAFYNEYFKHDLPLKGALEWLTHMRGTEVPELQGEINGIARAANVPPYCVHAMQMLYELQTVMVDLINITIPWLRGPGCTGIIARNSADGMVYHARNLDFSPKTLMQNLVYTGIFKRGGVEVFRAQMVAVYSCVVTGMRKGVNGWSYETNTRFEDHAGGNKAMWDNVFVTKRPYNGWTVRKVLETVPDYEAAVLALSTSPFICTSYGIISGVKKGTILARNPDGVAHQMTLGQTNAQCRDDYIIVTNFDYFFHDKREWFDYTSLQGLGHSRRIGAQSILNRTEVVTPQVLFTTIDDIHVRATDTIFQAIINVETGMWNVSLPALTADIDSTYLLV